MRRNKTTKSAAKIGQKRLYIKMCVKLKKIGKWNLYQIKAYMLHYTNMQKKKSKITIWYYTTKL